MSVSEITETRQYLTFKLGNEIFATDVAKVREVLDLTTITQIPRTPDFMAGVINLRGSVVPVVDLRLCFEMSKTESTRNTCIVVVEVLLDNESTVIGALTDSVEEVIDLEPEQIQPAPRIGTQIRTDFIKGMGKRDTQFIMILDIDRVFSAEELSVVRGQEAGKPEAAKQVVGTQPADKQQAACGSGRVREGMGRVTPPRSHDECSRRNDFRKRLCASLRVDLRAGGHSPGQRTKDHARGAHQAAPEGSRASFLQRVLRLSLRA
jgi:purine-binding chemotaxis protein CheW